MPGAVGSHGPNERGQRPFESFELGWGGAPVARDGQLLKGCQCGAGLALGEVGDAATEPVRDPANLPAVPGSDRRTKVVEERVGVLEKDLDQPSKDHSIGAEGFEHLGEIRSRTLQLGHAAASMTL